MLGYVYTKEDLSTIAPILWLQLLFVPLEVPLALFCSKDLSAIAPILWQQQLFVPLEVCLAMFTQKKIYQQLLLSSGGSYFSSRLRCCWLERSVSKLLPSSAICSLRFISKITTSFTFAFTCLYFHITFASLSRHLFLPFWVFPTLDLFQNC